MMLTAERAKKLLNYDPETGVFIWKGRVGAGRGHNLQNVGKRAGTLANGYRLIGIDGTKYRAARLAWLFTHGEWPSAFVDHIDMDRDNDRIANLRLATNSENMHNRGPQKNNSTGLKGVYYRKQFGDYAAMICVNKKRTWLGLFDTPEKAHEAYVDASKRLHREFWRAA